LRQQDDAIEVNVAVGFQEIDQRRRTRRAVAFAEQKFGRVPAAVFGQKPGDELREGVGVRIDAIECLLLVLTGNSAETGAGRVNKDEPSEKALLVMR
jgi:hypothetical protein